MKRTARILDPEDTIADNGGEDRVQTNITVPLRLREAAFQASLTLSARERRHVTASEVWCMALEHLLKREKL